VIYAPITGAGPAACLISTLRLGSRAVMCSAWARQTRRRFGKMQFSALRFVTTGGERLSASGRNLTKRCS
jgi:hypothetical protein